MTLMVVILSFQYGRLCCEVARSHQAKEKVQGENVYTMFVKVRNASFKVLKMLLIFVGCVIGWRALSVEKS